MGRIRVEKPDVKPDAPTYVKGVHRGNEGSFDSQSGHTPDGIADAALDRDQLSRQHDSVLPIMPNLPPG